jgi:hypothetical protein
LIEEATSKPPIPDKIPGRVDLPLKQPENTITPSPLPKVSPPPQLSPDYSKSKITSMKSGTSSKRGLALTIGAIILLGAGGAMLWTKFIPMQGTPITSSNIASAVNQAEAKKDNAKSDVLKGGLPNSNAEAADNLASTVNQAGAKKEDNVESGVLKEGVPSNNAGAADSASFLGISWSDAPDVVEAKLKKAGIFVPPSSNNQEKSMHGEGLALNLNWLLLEIGDKDYTPDWANCWTKGNAKSMAEYSEFNTSGLTKSIRLFWSTTAQKKKLMGYEVKTDSNHKKEIMDSLVSKYGNSLKGSDRWWKVGTDYVLLEGGGTITYLNTKEITSYCEVIRNNEKDSDEKAKKESNKLF